MSYVDAIILVSDVPALLTAIYQDEPGLILGPGVLSQRIARTPQVIAGSEALVYVRLSSGRADVWRNASGVNVLAERPYQSGADMRGLLEADIQGDAAAKAEYDRILDSATTVSNALDDAGNATQITLRPTLGGIA